MALEDKPWTEPVTTEELLRVLEDHLREKGLNEFAQRMHECDAGLADDEID